MKITNPITLDVARSNSYICLLAKQFDENSRFLIATLTNNGEPMIIPAGAAVTLRATRPDGEPVAVPGIINNDGTTTVEIDDYILEVVGSASLSIEVAIGDEILTSASFNLTIQRADGNGWLRVYVAAASLAAGNYYITIGDTPYAFTTTQAIPAGGSVYFASEGGTAQTRDASGNVLDASLTLTAGTSGTELTSDVPTMSFLTAIAGRMATIEAEMSQKANIDGSYPLLNAGSADNLMADTGATQAIPFIQEGTGKGNGEATVKAGGVLQLKKKLGNTVGVNQLIRNNTFADSSFWSVYNSSSAELEIASGIAKVTFKTASGSYTRSMKQTFTPVIGHKYLLQLSIKVSAVGDYAIDIAGTSLGKSFAVDTADVWTRIYKIIDTEGGTPSSSILVEPLLGVGDVGDTMEFRDIELHDLALWFGSNDRIPSDLLSHPENWGRYYAGSLDYAAGYLDSADGTVLKSIGRNVWDEEWEVGGINLSTGQNASANNKLRSTNYVPVIPNTAYYAKAKLTNGVLFYGADKTYLGIDYAAYPNNSTFTTPSNAYYMRFVVSDTYGTTYNHDITISLYYPGESGYDQYYPYSVLAEVDTGSEVLRSAGKYCDEKLPNGTISRLITVGDLGDLNWTHDNIGFFWANITNLGIIKILSTDDLTSHPISCAAYATTTLLTNATDNNWASEPNKTIGYHCAGSSGSPIYLYIKDTSYGSDAAAFKTGVTGTKWQYAEATPTTEQGTAFAENIPCDPDGTLSWTQTKGIPQGNEIFYPADLKGALDSIVAALPSANGTYTLHATVTTAGVTFSWS